VLAPHAPPCGWRTEAVRGTNPDLIVNFACDGEAEPFLIGVRVDGRFHALREVACTAYSTTAGLDLGPWSAPDTLWHSVEVVLDPLDLFKEVDEQNNRAVTLIRMIDPDIGLVASVCGFRLTADAGPNAGDWVEEVPAGTPVDVWLWLSVGGPYAGVQMRMQSGTVLDTTASRDLLDCASLSQGPPTLVKRWLPPGPGDYDVTFSVTPPAGASDRNPTNNQLVKRLRVTAG
jgi:hypothetical protein